MQMHQDLMHFRIISSGHLGFKVVLHRWHNNISLHIRKGIKTGVEFLIFTDFGISWIVEVEPGTEFTRNIYFGKVNFEITFPPPFLLVPD